MCFFLTCPVLSFFWKDKVFFGCKQCKNILLRSKSPLDNCHCDRLEFRCGPLDDETWGFNHRTFCANNDFKSWGCVLYEGRVNFQKKKKIKWVLPIILQRDKRVVSLLQPTCLVLF